jgi:diguanylate cyclase (GGDEF)-like protein/PAS domain S-box-containing protein
MRFPRLFQVSSPLRSRLAVTVSALVLGATLLVGPLALRVAERDMRAVVGSQEYALLSSAAAFIDDRLQDRLHQMEALAAAVPPDARADARRLQAWLSERPTGLGERLGDFVNLVAFAPNGELVATGSAMPSAQAVSASGRPYFEETLKRRRGMVSAPFISRLSGAQVVLVTAPVLGADGEVAYVLAGRLDLEHSNFLRQIDALKPGRTGYLYLMSAEGVVIDHPQRERLMQRAEELPGAHAGTLRALRGFEGWLHEADGLGGAIFAYKRLRTTGWILAARFPSEEAFAPLATLRREVMGASAALALLAGVLAWWMIRRQLAPLDGLRRGVAAILHKGADIGVLQVGRQDEIGELGRAFHALVHARERAVARMRAVADNIPAVIAYVDRDERCTFANAGFDQMLGLEPGAAIGRPIRESLGEAAYARFQPLIRAALAGERCHIEDVRSDDARRHQMIDGIPDIGADGQVAGYYVLAMDISERKEAELAQAASEQRLRLIADNLPVLICYIDRGHRLGFANATFRTWLGLDPARLAGTRLTEALGGPGYDSLRPRLKQAFDGASVRFEMSLAALERSRILEWTFVPDVQAGGKVAGVYALAHDMTRVKEAEAKLVRMARYDALTGIANRVMFAETLGRALERAQRQGAVLGLAYLDIDFFKQINDTWGHGVGDEVLKEFASRLSASVRATDTPARLAGDEFVIVFDGVRDRGDAEAIGAKVVQAMAAPFATSAGELRVTASVGITLADAAAGPLPSHDELLARADHALYAAKHGGRDRCVVMDG